MTQTTETEFAYYAKLSAAEQEALEQALESIPDDILSTGERQWIDSRIGNSLKRSGVLDTAGMSGPLQFGDIPALVFVSRAAGCLAANYATLQGISNNQPPEKVAAAIARTVTGCVSGTADEIRADILQYRSQIGRAFDALRLPSLRAALLAGHSTS